MLFLGIDLGTSYFKAGLFDENGQMKGFGRRPVSVRNVNGVSEVLRIVFWNTLAECITAALVMAGSEPADIKAVSYATQANSFIILDEAGRELTPFILWNDERAQINEAIVDFAASDRFSELTGIGVNISRQMLLNKLFWLKEYQPHLFCAGSRIVTMPDYLSLKLTRQHVADAGSLSLTGFVDYRKTEYIGEALGLAGVIEHQLPAIVATGVRVGSCLVGADYLPVGKGAVFTAGGLDHHIAAIGAGVGRFYQVSESTGTVLALIEHSTKDVPVSQVCISQGLQAGHFFRMAFSENGAVVLEWYQKSFAPGYSIDELVSMARRAPVGCDGLSAKPNANKYSGFEGFDRVESVHQHGHFVRAIMESTAGSLGELLNQLQVNPDNQIVNTGGGAKSELWREIKREITGHDFVLPRYGESACLGAALIAATGFGLFDDLTSAQAAWLDIVKR